MFKLIAVSIGSVFVVWTLLQIAIPLAEVMLGRATGIGLIVPSCFAPLPRVLAILLSLFCIPLLAGTVIGATLFWVRGMLGLTR